MKFEHKDALHFSKTWSGQRYQPLPVDNVGIDAVVTELTECLISDSSPILWPRCAAHITTSATTVSTIASAAALIASPQRYERTAFNFLEELSLNWMYEMFGFSDIKGLCRSGGSVANLVALEESG